MSEIRLCRLLLICLGGLLAFLFLVCLRIQVDNFDAFNLLLNAKAIAHFGGPYSIYRAIIPSLFFSPAFFVERWMAIPFLGFRLAHLMNAFLFLGLLWALFRLYLHHLSRWEALLAVFGFAFVPMVIHYVPIAKEDLPATLFVIMAFSFYLEGKNNLRRLPFYFSGLFTALAIGSRYNLIPVLFCTFFLNEMAGWKTFSIRERSVLRTKIVALFLLPVLLWLLFPTVLYPLLHIGTVQTAPLNFIKDLFTQYHTNTFVYKPGYHNYRFLLKGLSAPVLVVVAMGLFFSLKRKNSGSLFYTIWFSVFFLFQTYFVPGKEIRYLFPCFAPLFYFFVKGLQHWAVPKVFRPLYLPVLLTLGFFLPFYRGTQEAVKFFDRFYSVPFEKTVSLEAQKLAGDKQIIWLGNFYGIHPKDYIFDEADDFTYLYHFYVQQIHFYANKTALSLSGGRTLFPRSWQTTGVLLPELGTQIGDGDVLLINLEKTVSRTPTVPHPVPPLVMQRARKFQFTKGQGVPILPSYTEPYELYVKTTQNENYRSLGFFEIHDQAELSKLLSPQYSEAFLLSFDQVKLFHPPGNS